MSEQSPNLDRTLGRRVEQQLTEAGLQVGVEQTDGTLILIGVVDTEESREAATDLVSQIAPNMRVDNQIDIESRLPTDVDDFVADDPTAELADSVSEIRAGGGDIDPDFMDHSGITDPVEAAGAGSSESDDPA